MPSYIQKAKTTHPRCGGDGWFRACWEIPNPGNAESFCGCAIRGITKIVVHRSSMIDEMSDENVTLITLDFEGDSVFIFQSQK